MPDVREFQNLVAAAEKAAADGNIASAEASLREAAELQEATAGPLHPDLASTFNNLAVVCEMAHKPIEAEQFYRRAYAIASWSLSPGHPMVATARDNLRDFCVARGLPIEEWMDMETGAHIAPPAAAAPGKDSAPAVASVAAPPTSAPPSFPSAVALPPAPPAAMPARALPPAPARTASSRAAAVGTRLATPTEPARAAQRARRGLGVAVAVVAVLAALAIARQWRTPASDRVGPSSRATELAPPALDPLPDAAPSLAPVAVAAAPTPTPAPAAVAPPVTQTSPAPAPAPAAATAAATPAPGAPVTPAGVRVVTAAVCSALTTGGAWRCTAAGAAPAAGRLSYYTRVASPRGLRVQHRWYQGDRLRQDVTLNISANAVDGYRTFSRQTVGPGEWRVELRAAGGAVLDEARFVVR